MEENAKQRGLVVVDMDGTIADASRREKKFLRGQVKDWKGFFRDMQDDPPIQSVLDSVKELAKRFDIVILTGRPDHYREVTEFWLKQHGIQPVQVLMRPHGDTRPDYVTKAELLDTLRDREIVLALDDRGPVCEAYRKRGVKVLEVSSSTENQLINEAYRVMEEK